MAQMSSHESHDETLPCSHDGRIITIIFSLSRTKLLAGHVSLEAIYTIIHYSIHIFVLNHFSLTLILKCLQLRTQITFSLLLHTNMLAGHISLEAIYTITHYLNPQCRCVLHCMDTSHQPHLRTQSLFSDTDIKLLAGHISFGAIYHFHY
jgi:hypothetical protein